MAVSTCNMWAVPKVNKTHLPNQYLDFWDPCLWAMADGNPAQPGAAGVQPGAQQAAPAAQPAVAAQLNAADQAMLFNFLINFKKLVEQSETAHNNAHIQNSAHNEADAERQDRRDQIVEDDRNIREADVCVADITKCNGESPAAVRTWLEQVERSTRFTNSTLRVVMRTITGHMQKEVERFIGPGERVVVTWEQVKAFVTKTFLSNQDQEQLRQEVDQMVQKTYQSTKDYGRKYKEAVRLAYPTALDGPRNDISDRFIIHGYIRGLEDNELAKKLIRKGLPKTLDDAIASVEKLEAAEQEVVNMFPTSTSASSRRREEPMDIGAVTGTTAPQHKSTVESDLATVKRQVGGLSNQFTQIMAAFNTLAQQQQAAAPHQSRPQRHQQHPGGQRPRFEFSDDGKPICAYCHKKGHLRRECRKRIADNTRQNQGGQ